MLAIECEFYGIDIPGLEKCVQCKTLRARGSWSISEGEEKSGKVRKKDNAWNNDFSGEITFGGFFKPSHVKVEGDEEWRRKND